MGAVCPPADGFPRVFFIVFFEKKLVRKNWIVYLKNNAPQRKEISFKGQKVFIGIDVHKDSWRVAIAPEVGVVKGHSQKPSARELLDFLKKYYPDGEYHAVYESGFSGFSTYYALQDVGIDCIIIHAADVPTTQYEETMKTDKVDAAKLVRSLKSGLLTGIYIHKRDDIDARSVVRLRKTIQKQLGSYKSRVKHLLHSNGVTFPERFSTPGSHWSKVFIRWLKEEVVLLCQGTEPKRTLQTRLRVADIHSRSRGQCGDDTFD